MVGTITKEARELSDFLQTGENISSIVLEGEYWCRYIIMEDDSTDAAAGLEMTLHRLIELGYDKEDIFRLTGMTDEQPDEEMGEESIDIDLGYRIKNILSFVPDILAYKDAMSLRKPFIVKAFNDNFIAIVKALDEDSALRKARAYSLLNDLYAEDLCEDDDVYIIQN